MRRLILIAVAVMAVVAFAGVSAFAFGGGPRFSESGFGSTQARETDLEMLYQEALHKLEGEGDFEGAVALFERVAKKAEEISAIGAKALLHKGEALERLGRRDDAVEAYMAAAEAAAGSRVAAGARRALVRAGAADGQRRVSDEERLKARLEKRVPTFDFPNATFDIMIGVLRRLGADLNIVVSPNAATDQQFSLVLKNTTIADILSHVTRLSGLRWTIWKGAVYISGWQEIAVIEQEKAAEEARAPVAEVAVPISERLTVNDELMKAMQALFEARMKAARNEVQRATQLFENGAAPMSAVENAQLKVREAQVAQRALARGSDAEIRSLLATLAGSDNVRPLLEAAMADVPKPPAEAPAVSEDSQVYETTLADADLDTPGPQGLDLDTNVTISFPGRGDGIKQDEWFAAHPELDLFYDRQLVLMGADAQAALLPPGADATSAALTEVTYNYKPMSGGPNDIEGAGVYLAEHPRLGRFIVIEPGEYPIYVETAGGAYFIKVTRRAEDHITLTWQRISPKR